MRWRRATPEDRQLAWLWGAAAFSAVVLRPLWFAVAPALPACPLRTLTTIPCPSCGSTRAGLALLHADVAGALRLNPLAALAGIAFVVGGGAAPLWVSFGGPVPDLPARWPLWARLGAVSAILLDWLWLLVALP